MSKEELILSCVKAINSGANPPLVIFIMKGSRKTLSGKGSPRGQILEERKGENVIAFNAIDILAYMKAKGMLSFSPAPLPALKPDGWPCT